MTVSLIILTCLPLGKNDNVALNLIFHCSSEIDFSSGSIDRLSYDKADYEEMNEVFFPCC